MIHNLDTPLGADQAVRGSLEIHLAQTTADWEIAHQMLDEEHFLDTGREAGDRLCQFVIEHGEVVAVLICCAAAWHLKDGDTIIGWDPVIRSQRLKLLIQLRRFLILDQARRPRLQSHQLDLRGRHQRLFPRPYRLLSA